MILMISFDTRLNVEDFTRKGKYLPLHHANSYNLQASSGNDDNEERFMRFVTIMNCLSFGTPASLNFSKLNVKKIEKFHVNILSFEYEKLAVLRFWGSIWILCGLLINSRHILRNTWTYLRHWFKISKKGTGGLMKSIEKSNPR